MLLFGFETVVHVDDVSIIKKDNELVLLRAKNLSPKTILSQIPTEEIRIFCMERNLIVTNGDISAHLKKKEEEKKRRKANELINLELF